MRMVVQYPPKQPDEEVPVAVDFAPCLIIAGEIISGATVRVAEEETGVDVTSAMLVAGSIGISGGTVAFRLKSGSDGKNYVATARTTTNVRQGNADDAEVKVPVRERPQ